MQAALWFSGSGVFESHFLNWWTVSQAVDQLELLSMEALSMKLLNASTWIAASMFNRKYPVQGQGFRHQAAWVFWFLRQASTLFTRGWKIPQKVEISTTGSGIAFMCPFEALIMLKMLGLRKSPSMHSVLGLQPTSWNPRFSANPACRWTLRLSF